MTPRTFIQVACALCLGTLLPGAALHAGLVDSSRYRIYITVTDSLTGRSAKAALGFHPQATLALDAFTMYGFNDHWYESDSPWVYEYPSPPLGFFEELRIQNVRQKFSDNGLLFGNIHAYTGPAEVDTFIVMFNGDMNAAEDSAFVYTHPQLMTWPSVLRFYADSIIMRDVSNNAQTVAGANVRVNLTTDSTWTYFGDRYFNPDLSIYTVDPLHKGFFVYVYHPKISPPPPAPVSLDAPANGATGVALNTTLQWGTGPAAFSYKVQLDIDRGFSHPVVSDVLPGTSRGVTGLAANTWYYWRASVSNPYGVSYYQNPPDSFQTTSSTDVRGEGPSAPKSFALFQNYPNPFNPSTRMEFAVPKAAQVTVTVFDALGRRLATLVRGEYKEGIYSAVWNGADERGTSVPSGVYFARMVADPAPSEGRTGTRVESTIRMVVLK